MRSLIVRRAIARRAEQRAAVALRHVEEQGVHGIHARCLRDVQMVSFPDAIVGCDV